MRRTEMCPIGDLSSSVGLSWHRVSVSWCLMHPFCTKSNLYWESLSRPGFSFPLESIRFRIYFRAS